MDSQLVGSGNHIYTDSIIWLLEVGLSDEGRAHCIHKGFLKPNQCTNSSYMDSAQSVVMSLITITTKAQGLLKYVLSIYPYIYLFQATRNIKYPRHCISISIKIGKILQKLWQKTFVCFFVPHSIHLQCVTNRLTIIIILWYLNTLYINSGSH